MTTPERWNLALVSDEQLLRDLSGLLAGGARVEARIVAHLAEVEERRLHLKAASSSMFDYCLRRIGLSESEAFHRLTAARLARRFPVIFELLEARSIHLSALRILRDHLTCDNHRELLAMASGKSKQEVEFLVAGLAPRPDVPSRIRKLPAARRRARVALVCTEALSGESMPSADGATAALEPDRSEPLLLDANGLQQPPVTAAATATSAVSVVPLSRHRDDQPSRESAEELPLRGSSRTRALEPLSSSRYLLRATISRELKDKIERARALMSHANPGGELTPVLERALDLLLEKLEKQRFAQTKRPRHANHPSPNPHASPGERPTATGSPSTQSPSAQSPSAQSPSAQSPSAQSPSARSASIPRRAAREHIPNEIRRAVASRDGERCTYVDGAGRRCESRSFLQLHHEFAHALGGPSTIENMRLLCAAHNRLLAERDFGRLHQERFIRREPSSNAPRATMTVEVVHHPKTNV